MKNPLSIIISATCTALLSGCASPPMAPPDLPLYRPDSEFGTPDKKSKPHETCILKSPPMSEDIAIKRTYKKLYVHSCIYGKSYYRTKDFLTYTDQSAIGISTLGIIGALTDSSSTFIKGSVGLAALSLGLKEYTNPQTQMNTYQNAAKATQCMANTLKQLNETFPEPQDLTASKLHALESTVRSNASTLRQAVSNKETLKKVIETTEKDKLSEALKAIAQSDNDEESKISAIRFLKDIETINDNNLSTIQDKVNNTLYDQAFKVESATKIIREVTLGSDNGEALTALNLGSDEKFPFNEVIRLNNIYTECMTSFSGS